MDLPEDGGVATTSCQGTRAYYLAPRRLIEIDVDEWEITRSLDIPFESASFAFYKPD